MKLILKKLVNFMNFIFCVFKVLQCTVSTVWFYGELTEITHKTLSLSGYQVNCMCFMRTKIDISLKLIRILRSGKTFKQQCKLSNSEIYTATKF